MTFSKANTSVSQVAKSTKIAKLKPRDLIRDITDIGTYSRSFRKRPGPITSAESEKVVVTRAGPGLQE